MLFFIVMYRTINYVIILIQDHRDSELNDKLGEKNGI